MPMNPAARHLAGSLLILLVLASSAWAQAEQPAAGAQAPAVNSPPTGGAATGGGQPTVSPTPAPSAPAGPRSTLQGSFQLVVWGTVAYLVTMLGFRLFTIAQPARKLLSAEIESLALKLQMEAGSATRGELGRLQQEVDAVRGSQEWSWDEWIREPLFWSGGRELTAWRRIHEVERHLAMFMAPSDRVVQRAITLEASLRGQSSRTAAALADRLRATLDQPADVRSTEQLRHQLAEALTCAYNEQDNKFVALMEWHNKAMWMVTLALLAILSLSLMFDRSELFFLGAVGGLMSRMMRSLHREDVPTDYGASWTTLFLSPLLGAIAAWFGVAGIDMLSDMEVVGGALGRIDWDVPSADALTMFTAFLLGFSERLFMSLLSNVEGRIDTEIKREPQSQPIAQPKAGAAGAGPALRPSAARRDPVAPIGAPASAAVVADLDLEPGERAIFVGDAMSPLRLRLLSLAGAGNVEDAALEQLAAKNPADAILLEKLPDAAGLQAASAACATALRGNGRIVAVGSTPAGLYDDDASVQAQQNVVGPSLLHATMTAAGLLAEEPPERLGGPDPVHWSAVFRKP